MFRDIPKVHMAKEGLVTDELEPQRKSDRITQNDDLFVIAHLGIPETGGLDWNLDICGLVETPLTLKPSDLSAFPKRTVETVHKCAGNPVDPTTPTRQVGNVVWGGIDIRDLMKEAGVLDTASFLWAFGPDHGEIEDTALSNYQKDVPLSRIADGDVLLAYELNGEPLSVEHGFPMRLVVPGYYATNSVKWLYRLEFADRRSDGFFTTTLYNDPDLKTDPTGQTLAPVWELPPESLIVSPATNAELQMGETEIRGWAWSNCAVDTVEVSTDGGRSWDRAKLEPRKMHAWQRFSYMWTPRKSGTFDIQCRATDVKGETQPEKSARNAVHSVGVNVADF